MSRTSTETLLAPGAFEPEPARAAARSLLDLPDRPTAVFAANDLSAIATLVILKVTDVAVGLRVPEEEEREGLDVTQHGERIA